MRYSIIRSGLRSKCGGQPVYMKNNGRIASPGFPMENYGNNLNCFWKIWAPINHGINLTFNLTNLADETKCSDKIQVELLKYDFEKII